MKLKWRWFPVLEVCFVYILPFLVVAGTFLFVLVFRWDWAATHETLAIGVLTLAVLAAGLTAALWTLIAIRRDRAAQMVIGLNECWNSGTILEAKVLRKKMRAEHKNFYQTVKYYEQHCPDQYTKLESMPSLFEFFGWLARKHCISVKWLYDLLPISEVYEDWKNLIKEAQVEEEIIKQGEEPKDTEASSWGNFVWLRRQKKG